MGHHSNLAHKELHNNQSKDFYVIAGGLVNSTSVPRHARIRNLKASTASQPRKLVQLFESIEGIPYNFSKKEHALCIAFGVFTTILCIAAVLA